jgi:hypothetical protein
MPAKNDGKGSTVTSGSGQLRGKCNCKKQTVNNTDAAARKAPVAVLRWHSRHACSGQKIIG